MRTIQKTMKHCIELLLAVCMVFCVCFAFGTTSAKRAFAEESPQPAEITGVQIKRVTNNGSQFAFIALQSPVFENKTGDVSNVDNYNFRESVTVYSSPTDTTGVTLLGGGLVGGWCAYNYMDWGYGLMMFYNNATSPAWWWNGKQIYKMTIAEGCQLPCGDAVYTTSESVTFVNMDWNEDDALENANNWVKYDANDHEVYDVQVRSLSAGENFIVLQSPVYFGEVLSGGVSDVSAYNTASKVKAYLKDGTELAGLIGGWWEYSYNGPNKYAIGLWMAYNNQNLYTTYNGQTIYKIVVEAGCQLPCGGNVYTTTETRTFYNLEYGKESAVSGAQNWQNASFVKNAVSAEEQANTLHVDGTTVSGMTYEGVYNVESKNAYYFYNRRAVDGVNAEVKFVTTDNSIAKTAELSFDYKIKNTSAAYVGGIYTSYSVQVIKQSGESVSVDFAPVADGEWHTWKFIFEKDVRDSFVGFVVKAGGLEGEMLIANITATDDTTAPVITVSDIKTEYDEGETLSYIVSAEDALYGTTSVTLQKQDGMTDEEGKLLPGTWKIKFLSEDKLGNKAETEEYTITVKDKTAPVVTLGGKTEYEAGTAYTENSALELTVAITDNVDGKITDYTVEMPEGAVKNGKLQIGEWTVTVKATDVAGNEGTQTIQITVRDTEKPVITVDNEQTKTRYDEGEALAIVATAIDSYEGEVNVEFVIPDGAVKDGKLVAGEWTVALTAQDKSGNSADPVNVTIKVNDKTAPVITLGGKTEYEAGTAYIENSALELTVAITDNVDGEITDYTVEMPEGAIKNGKLQIGEWTVTVRATDTASNEGSQTIQITVRDTEKPVITVDNEQTKTQYDEGDELAIVATAIDSYDGEVNVEFVIPEGAVKDGKLVAGDWIITLTAQDKSGNSAEEKTVIIRVGTYYAVRIGDNVQTVKKGNKLVLPELKKEGYEFTGLYSDENCTVKFDYENTAITSDMTLYVGWREITSDDGGCVSSISGTTAGVALAFAGIAVVVMALKRKKRA